MLVLLLKAGLIFGGVVLVAAIVLLINLFAREAGSVDLPTHADDDPRTW